MVIDKIALALAIIGALNWGGIGLFGFDTVAFLCGGQMAILSRIIYALVGLAGLWCITLLFRSSDEETGRPPHRLTADTARFSKYGEPTKRPAPRICGSQSPEQISRGPCLRRAPLLSGISGPWPEALRRRYPVAPSSHSGLPDCCPPRWPAVRRAGIPASAGWV